MQWPIFAGTMEGKATLPRVLASFQPGESGVVSSVAVHALTPKLVEMGIYAGKEIKVLFRAPFGGPLAVEIGDYTLSMREEEAGLVLIESTHE
jgi:ferrous iron transport protein A